MFNDDGVITSVNIALLKEHDDDFEDCSLDELLLCAYMDGLKLSDYAKAVIESDYDL